MDNTQKKSWKTNARLLFQLLIISVIINFLVVSYTVGKKLYYSHYNVFRKESVIPPNDSLITFTFNKVIVNKAHTDFFKMRTHTSDDIVFLGNSLTAGFPLQEMFQNLKLKNRGIGGNTTKDILLRLDEVVDGKPQKIFLEIGINDISQSISLDTVFKNFKEINRQIKQNSPLTKVYIQSVFPTALAAKVYLPKVDEYNKKIEKYCIDNGLVFINLYPVFYKNDQMDLSLTTDGVHLNGKGYFLWKSQIEKYVSE